MKYKFVWGMVFISLLFFGCIDWIFPPDGGNATLNQTSNVTNQTIPPTPTQNQTTPPQQPPTQNQTPPAPPAQPPLQNQTPPTQPAIPTMKISGMAVIDEMGGRTRNKQCSVELDPYAIEAGAETGVTIYAYSPQNEKVTYLCGDEEIIAGYGGLMNHYHLCQFDEIGLVDVWLALDGNICASAPLRVYTDITKDNRMCQVITGTNKNSVGIEGRTYWASVYVASYDSDVLIKWKCSDAEFSQKLGEVLYGNKATGVLNISCTYSLDPGYVDEMPVHVESDYCGDLISGS
ncbi:MAG: hypothetical protein ABIH83_00550 [Candidatus Micrarchaeota archaeon]